MTTQTRTKRRLTKEQAKARRVEKLRPLAKAVLYEIWSNPEKHPSQDSLARHFGISKNLVREVIRIVLDHEVPPGLWVEGNPYRVVTYTDSKTFETKMGFLEGDLLSLQRTAKSFQLTNNSKDLVDLGELIGNAAGVVRGVKKSVTNELDKLLTEEYQRNLIENLRAEIEATEGEIEALS